MSNALRIGNRSISYEQAKEMLFPELIPQKGNEAMLSTVPHEKVEDMAVVFRLDLYSESGMMMSTRENQAILDGFGVTADQIKQDALENASHTHPASFRSMQEVFGDMMGGFHVPGPDPGQPALISCLRPLRKRMTESRRSKHSGSTSSITARPGKSTLNISGCRKQRRQNSMNCTGRRSSCRRLHELPLISCRKK